jgi:cell division septation protein DedD
LNKRVFKGLGLAALLLGLLILLFLAAVQLLILYHPPVPTDKLEEKPQTLPGVSEAPGTPPPLPNPIAPPLEQPPAAPGKGVGTSETTPPETAISPPAAKEHPLTPLKEEKKYGLLVGAFPDFPSAEKMLDKIENQGEQGFIRRTPGKKNGSQVIAGPFSSRREALIAAISLKNKLNLQTIIIPLSK